MLLPEVKGHYGRLQFLIDGEWVDSISTESQEVKNPATDEVIAELPCATEEEMLQAVQAAQRGFEIWRNTPVRERAHRLFAMHHLFGERHEELSRILSQDHGRTIGEARGSVSRVLENIESACAAVYGLARQNEAVLDLAAGVDEYLFWEPLGPFLIVTPGNIPMHAWSSFVPYALAAGCSVVISPSRQAPIAAEAVNRVALDAGFPRGVINMIHGGRRVNSDVLRHPSIKGVGFIGSNRAGWELFALCGQLGKTSSVNGNGKNYVVIMPDADLDAAIPWLVRACFGMTGQRCLGADNVVVVGAIYEEVRTRLRDAAVSLRLGYGLDTDTDMGPYATRAGMQKVERWIDGAIAEGAHLVLDGREAAAPGYPNGYFLGPTILENVNVDMASAKEEAFGAVASLIRCDSLDESIEWINTKTQLGHSASIMTSAGESARRFMRDVNVGNVGVNVGVPQPYAFFPLGSRRQSFVGTAKSRLASMKLFMDEKTVTARWV